LKASHACDAFLVSYADRVVKQILNTGNGKSGSPFKHSNT
jgi:hypothetical protein